MSKVHIVSLIENYSSYGFGEAGKMYHSAESVGDKGVEFTLPGTGYRRYGLSFWDANCVGRDVQSGPVAQRPQAILSAQASVISATPFPKPATLALNFGDYLVDPALDLILRVVKTARAEYPDVEIVSCQPATVDYSELVAAKNAEPKVYVSEAWLSG